MHADNKGIIDGFRRGKRVYQAKSTRCRLVDKSWEELHELVKKRQHVKGTPHEERKRQVDAM